MSLVVAASTVCITYCVNQLLHLHRNCALLGIQMLWSAPHTHLVDAAQILYLHAEKWMIAQNNTSILSYACLITPKKI